MQTYRRSRQAVSPVNIVKPPEHKIGRLRSQREYTRTVFEVRSQLGEGQPDGCRARVAQTSGVDEYALRLDAEQGTQKIRHAPICLVWDDVVYCLDIGPERARGRNSVIEELWSATPDRREIVFELESPAFDEGFVRAASMKCEARLTAEAYLAEEVAEIRAPALESSTPTTNRRGTVSHHHEIDQLAYVFASMLRVEVDRTRLGTNDRDSLDSGAGGESLGNHQRVCKAGAGLTKFQYGPVSRHGRRPVRCWAASGKPALRY